MLDKKQKEWVGKVSKTLGIAEMGEQDQAKQKYAETLKLLTPRLKNALKHDKDGVLGGKINTAVKFAQSGSYIDAQNTLDDAGQYATQLMSSEMETHEGSGELIGKALPGKYKNEQFQKDKEGNVMHGGEFRANSKSRTNYYTDEEREKSIVRTDDQGRLVDSEGKFLPKDRGFVVSQDEGTLHSFDTNEQKIKDGYTVYTHHSSPIQGGNAAAGGEMTTEDGVLRKVTDQSGHYRPTPEMTHQFVERLQDQGVAMREQKLTMTGKDGEPTDATSEIEELWNEVNEYEKQRQGTDPSAPYDKEMLEKKQKLQDLGVGMSNREAKVDLTNPKTFVTPEEFEKVKGDYNAVVGLVKQKVGVQPNVQFFKGDANSLDQVNDWIGVLSRVQALEPQGKYVDTKKTRLQMTTEQFAQTGGNVDAIRGKEGVNAEIEKLRTPDESPEDEKRRLTDMIKSLGGDAKLITLGVKDPGTLTVEQKFLILSKGRVPENLLGGEPEPSIVLDESLSEEEMRERLMKLPPKPPRNMDEVEDPFADYEDEEEEKEEDSLDSEDDKVGSKGEEENLSDEEMLERLMKMPPKPPRNLDDVPDPFADSEDEDDEDEEEKDEKQEEVGAKTGGETRNKYLVEDGPGGYDPLAVEMKSNSPNDLKEESSSEDEEHEEVGTETGGKPNKYLQESGPGGYDPLAEGKSYKPNDQKEEDSLEEEQHEEVGSETGGNPNKYLQESGPGGYDSLAEGKSYKPNDQKEEDSLEEDEHEEVGTETGGNPNKYLQESGPGGYDPLAEGKSYKPSDQKEESSSEEGEDEEDPSSRPPKEKYSKVELGEGEKESVDPFADDEDEEEEEEHEFPVAQQPKTQQPVAKNVKDLNLKSQKPVAKPHPRQIEFDQLGGDQALLEKLLPPWKSRNQPVLNKLLDLNKRLKTAVGTDKEQLATAIKTLTTEIDKRDRMPTLNSLAKMPIEEKIDQLKN